MPIPLAILAGVGVVGLASMILTSCGSSEEKKPDAAPPPPPPKPQTDTFPKDPSLHYVDQDSFDAFNMIWPSPVTSANLANWQPRTRLYAGAIEELYRPTCEKRDQFSQGPVGALIKGAATFLGDHYKDGGKVDASEEGILVLLGGFAPSSIAEGDVFAAYDALAKEKPSQKDFAELMKAAWWFNKAVEKADRRFTGPVAGAKMSVQDRKEAGENLNKMDQLLSGIKVENLSDRQREFLTVLKAAAAKFKASLPTGGGCTGPNCGKKDTGGGWDKDPNPSKR